MIEQFFHPQLSPSAETFLRICAGTLLFFQALATAPHARRFYTTERYGGYTDSTPLRDAILRPQIVVVLEMVWLASILAIVLGFALPVAAAINFALARYFYVRLRWHGILRGMGAPGHMNQWLSGLLLGLALADAFDVTGALRAAVVFTFRLDFALIMIVAGIYKVTAGYPRNEGMERGMVNPYWGFWWAMYKRVHPRSSIFAACNHLAYLTEIGAGVMMLIPPLAVWGALALALSFVFIAANIRLTFLAEVVAVCCLLFVSPGDVFDRLLTAWLHAAPATPAASQAGMLVAGALATMLYVYAAALPLAYAAMCYNFYARKRLWEPLQVVVDWWQRTFGLILWRVFTIDVTNFYVLVYGEDRTSGKRRLISDIRPFDIWRGARYSHVAEFICLASVFTTLKYFPHDPALFQKRLRRYAGSLRLEPNEIVLFEYIAIIKTETYDFTPVREFRYDPQTSSVSETVLVPEYEVRSGASTSPVHAGAAVGTYAPRAS
ncbi:MAG: hypothetical protein JO241_01775 [Candidatus Eremiobacteraeota bacterium]|nr:hypothetical protein [Candidatus Eremiobacteraeota bacterium]